MSAVSQSASRAGPQGRQDAPGSVPEDTETVRGVSEVPLPRRAVCVGAAARGRTLTARPGRWDGPDSAASVAGPIPTAVPLLTD